MKNNIEIKNIFLAFFIISIFGFFIFVADITPEDNETLFVVKDENLTTAMLAEKLYSESFISSKWLFKIISSVSGVSDVESGGYFIKKGVSLFKMVHAFSKEPDLVWIRIKEGKRKEEIADIIGEKLNWNEDNKYLFINTHRTGNYQEGVYFPDTYLVPKNITGNDMAGRMINKFNEELEPYTEEFIDQNIKWITGLKLASIIQREAASEEEMDLIAGIFWNRLEEGMRLQADATLQYMNGKRGDSWWKPISIEDKENDSLYNTYKYEGLPPTPISNPGIEAIKAVLYPRETDCMYYIHADRQIYCSESYDEHINNINEYLK